MARVTGMARVGGMPRVEQEAGAVGGIAIDQRVSHHGRLQQARIRSKIVRRGVGLRHQTDRTDSAQQQCHAITPLHWQPHLIELEPPACCAIPGRRRKRIRRTRTGPRSLSIQARRRFSIR